ncbi:hypothetical protein PoB_006776600 [Plakobranchus ocellatus]|uniref:Uncharacterized protein n=1 Tax=Plakobranchus ocellatus TaxID=259542 RepID=A0AAV4DAU7_9GAST|nr:hypothetical protein PoB_006776600 [Plakobranchus ocellatus]
MSGPTPSHSPSPTDVTTETSSPHFDKEDNSSQDKKPSSYTITHTLETTETHGTNTCKKDLRNTDSSHSDRTNTTYTADNAAGISFSTNTTCTANQVHDSFSDCTINTN